MADSDHGTMPSLADYIEDILGTPVHNSRHIDLLVESLPHMTEKQLEDLGEKDAICGICMQPLLAILAEEEMASVMESPALYSNELGVTRLSQPWQCGHVFCKRDITKWITTGNLTCPMCRKHLLDPSIPLPKTTGTAVGDFDTIIEELERILEHGDPFSVQNPSDDGPASAGAGRHEFSGMYS